MLIKQNHNVGALVGVLSGDALGAPYETRSDVDVATDFLCRGGLVPHAYPEPWHKKHMLPAGRPTDDSDQTAALAQSLIVCRGPNPEDLYNRLRKTVYDNVSPLWSGKAFGAGGTTKRALKPDTYQQSQALSAEGAFPSNGALMRSVPLALYFGRPEKVDREVVRVMSEVTHRHPFSTEVCVAYIHILSGLLTGAVPEKAIKYAARHTEDKEIREICRRPGNMPRDPEVWPGRGAAKLTLEVALWALTTTSSFRDGITAAVSVGGDTDTYAAVAGGLLGTYYGTQGIPIEWRNVLLGSDVMERYALALMHLSEQH